MSAFLLTLAKEFPDLVAALDEVDQIVGNRPVDVLEVLAREDDLAPKIRAMLDAVVGDLTHGIEQLRGGDDARHAGMLLLAAALRSFEVGLWLGQRQQASLMPSHARARLKVLDRRR